LSFAFFLLLKVNKYIKNQFKFFFMQIILGIDPGTTVMGYGIINVLGNKMTVLQYGVLKLHKYNDQQLKLQKILETTIRLIKEFLPDEMAVEMPFYGVNPQSMLKLGRAQGVVMAAGLLHQIPVAEYLPLKVKQSVTGNGKAAKEQVAAMLQQLLDFKSAPEDMLDATDALAVAVCHHFNRNSLKSKTNSWERFVTENQNRVKKP
jgi:crossover junction endodeoxyribonuclease RuvC